MTSFPKIQRELGLPLKNPLQGIRDNVRQFELVVEVPNPSGYGRHQFTIGRNGVSHKQEQSKLQKAVRTKSPSQNFDTAGAATIRVAKNVPEAVFFSTAGTLILLLEGAQRAGKFLGDPSTEVDNYARARRGAFRRAFRDFR